MVCAQISSINTTRWNHFTVVLGLLWGYTHTLIHQLNSAPLFEHWFSRHAGLRSPVQRLLSQEWSAVVLTDKLCGNLTPAFCWRATLPRSMSSVESLNRIIPCYWVLNHILSWILSQFKWPIPSALTSDKALSNRPSFQRMYFLWLWTRWTQGLLCHASMPLMRLLVCIWGCLYKDLLGGTSLVETWTIIYSPQTGN